MRDRHSDNQQDNYLLGAFDLLLKECDRLQKRVRYLESQLGQKKYEPSGYPDLDGDGVDNEYYDQFFKPTPKKRKRNRTYRSWQKKETEPEKPIEIKSVSRRSTSDLYREASARYEKQQSEKLQKIEDENNYSLGKQETRQPEEVLGEQRARYYAEQAKLIVDNNKN